MDKTVGTRVNSFSAVRCVFGREYGGASHMDLTACRMFMYEAFAARAVVLVPLAWRLVVEISRGKSSRAKHTGLRILVLGETGHHVFDYPRARLFCPR